MFQACRSSILGSFGIVSETFPSPLHFVRTETSELLCAFASDSCGRNRTPSPTGCNACPSCCLRLRVLLLANIVCSREKIVESSLIRPPNSRTLFQSTPITVQLFQAVLARTSVLCLLHVSLDRYMQCSCRPDENFDMQSAMSCGSHQMVPADRSGGTRV